MYGGDAYGGAAYGAGTAPEDIFDVDAMLSSSDALVVTAEIRTRRVNSAVHRSDDFGRATIGGGLPAGWTSQWTAGTYDVIADPVGGSASGQELQLTGASSTYRCLRLDATGAAIDMDVVASVRMAGLPAGTAIVGGVAARVSGSAGTHTGYLFALVTSSGSPVAVAMYSAAAGSVTFKAAAGFAWAAGSRYLLRLQCIGTAIKGKVWAAGTAEPAAWTIEITDSAVAGGGYGGFFSFVNEADPFCDYLAVALDGGPAALAGEETIRIASAEWATAPTDVPASAPFDGRLASYQFNRLINTGDRFGGLATGEGSIVFANGDGAFDGQIDRYAIDGRAVTVRIGRLTDPFENHFVLCKGVAVDWEADQDSVTLSIEDKAFLLDVPAQPSVYAGTGDEEGGSSLGGKRKPLVFSLCNGIEPVLVDAALNIYQCSSRPGSMTVFDRGAILSGGVYSHADYAALAAATVAPGTFDEYQAEGFFRLGATPDGIVTANCEAGLQSLPDPNTTADIIRAILDHATDLTEADLDIATFDVVLLQQDAWVNRFVGLDDSSTVADVIAATMAGVGGWAGFNRDGRLAIGIFTAPGGDPVARFDRDDGSIIDLGRERLPDSVWPSPWRWRVAHGWTETVFTDFAGTVSDSVRQRYSQSYSLREASDATILDGQPQAKDPPPVEARFVGNSDAQAEADRLLALYASGYRLWRFETDLRALTRGLGDEINVTFPRFGLDAGRDLRIVSIEDKFDLSDGGAGISVEITAFG